jgi:carboxyl-terminal processing protease
MVFKGRTVIAFVLLAMFASSILTLTIVEPSMFADKRNASAQGGGSDSGLSSKDLNKITRTYSLIESKYLEPADHDKIINGAINGMISSLGDPFTTYMDEKEASQFEESLSSSFQGIGAEVSMVDGRVTVVSPIKGSPAEKAGIRANDTILTINGEKLDGLSLSQAVMKIRGPRGTQAKLGILRQGSSDPMDIIVVRGDIPQETVYSEMMDNGIGKIEIRQFSENTATRFAQELKSLESQNMRGLIIDVRDDPGGILPVVVSIVEPFVPKGKPIVQIEDRDGKREPTNSKGEGKGYPVTVLINKGSASASEILAGAFKEAVGGKVIGETSFGKGTVQVTTEMGDGSNIKMTEYKWLTPDGNWIHKKGITPDIVVEQPEYFKAVPLDKNKTLKSDMAGEDVKDLQIMLKGVGLQPGREDGYFDDKTTLAVKSFQRLQNLEMTGQVDSATATKLEDATIAAIKDPKNDLQLQAAIRYLQGVLNK